MLGHDDGRVGEYEAVSAAEVDADVRVVHENGLLAFARRAVRPVFFHCRGIINLYY